MPNDDGSRPARLRLDQYLVQTGWSETRQKAQAAIMAGRVYVDGRLVDKPGFPVPPGAQVAVKGEDMPFVSRGGLKLAHALDRFAFDVSGLVCLDVGASTGGFTDCLLQRGAARVYAVDVGYGQLAWRLRQDERVVVMERTNARYLKPTDLPEPVQFAVIDVSFISLRKILPAVAGLLVPEGRGVALVKPQFEAGRGEVGKGGVVRDRRVHRRVLEELGEWLPSVGLQAVGLTASPIRGPKGNVEFLLAFRKVRHEVGQGAPDAAREGQAGGDVGTVRSEPPSTPPGPADWSREVEAALAEAAGPAGGA